VILTWLGCAWGLTRVGRRAEARGVYDAIIVPGCAVRATGTPSPALERRVRGAVDAWQQGRAPVVVLTGGVGTHGHREAEVAARRCLELGLPPEAVVVEGRSKTTRENASFAVHCVPRGRDARVLVVTDAYHVLRARRLFRRAFREADAVASQGAAAPHRWKPAVREVGAILRARGRGWA